jgi:hypothetical protein
LRREIRYNPSGKSGEMREWICQLVAVLLLTPPLLRANKTAHTTSIANSTSTTSKT